jgi:heat shock gene repressor HrcA
VLTGFWIDIIIRVGCMEFQERNKRVLQAVIDSYIASGAPIGSTVLVKKYDFHVSSATLRNIMAELEELGYLTHPHTSAGRIPTDLGYRYYIDSLISIEKDADDLATSFGRFLRCTAMTYTSSWRRRAVSLLRSRNAPGW